MATTFRPSTFTAPTEWNDTCEQIAHRVAEDYHYPGADENDVIQEARIGIWKAMRDWNQEAGSSWEGFAYLCARRQAITGLKTAQREKHRPCNEAVSMDAKFGDGEGDDETLGERLFFRENDDPAVIVLARDELRRLLLRFRLLSPLEREAVERCVLLGEQYTAVGDQKAVDNAIQRARRKLADDTEPIAPVHHCAVLIDRELHPTREQAVHEAGNVAPGCEVIGLQKRKLRKGRVVAPQGRSASDGSLGRPVWQLEIAA